MIIFFRYLNETLAENYRDFRANPLHLGSYADERVNYTAREFFSSFSHLLMSEAEARRGCEATSEEGPSGSGAYIIVIVIESIVIVLFVGLSIKRCMGK